MRKNKAELRHFKHPSFGESSRYSDVVTGKKWREKARSVIPFCREDDNTVASNPFVDVDLKTDHEVENNHVRSESNDKVSNSKVTAPLATVTEVSKSEEGAFYENMSEKESLLTPAAVGDPTIPTTVEGLNVISSQPDRGVSTLGSPKKRVRNVLKNSRDIASFLGYYANTPSSVEISQKGILMMRA